ncbi:MAG: hypothetical protein M5U34_27335 [Chloroflexi bacterium]|nr:hypothetical protein [Chloroflexota bacterium]
MQARVDAINAEFGPAGKTPLLKRTLSAAEIEALAPTSPVAILPWPSKRIMALTRSR